ncbi:MAG: HAD family hydrolase [Phycisphaerae bacterium]
MMATRDAPLGVIFDLDGVLIDSAELHFQSWRRLAEEQGAGLTRAQFHATFGRQNRDIIPDLFGVSAPDRVGALADRKEEIYRNLVRGRPPVVDGAVELIRGLAALDARLAIGSSAPRQNIDLILNEVGVHAAFEAIISGDDVARGKPDPQVFALACEALGLAPARCVVIEDAPAGVQAAITAGAVAVAVLIHHDEAAFDGVALCVHKLAELTPQRILNVHLSEPRG